MGRNHDRPCSPGMLPLARWLCIGARFIVITKPEGSQREPKGAKGNVGGTRAPEGSSWAQSQAAVAPLWPRCGSFWSSGRFAPLVRPGDAWPMNTSCVERST